MQYTMILTLLLVTVYLHLYIERTVLWNFYSTQVKKTEFLQFICIMYIILLYICSNISVLRQIKIYILLIYFYLHTIVETILVSHSLCQFQLGSYGDGFQKRKRMNCRNCPNTNEKGQRKNNWNRMKCNFAFHPICFQLYYEVNSPNSVHRKCKYHFG